ncbi:MAG: signal peptidase II, partial [Gemmatimonadetes bacterium]|nr:signal peptidase II [Gemmatimonadota bacterium]
MALVLDQLTKWWVLQTMTLGESVPVLGSFFKLTYIHNPGAVFG